VEWSEDTAELVCEHSAVIRLGARVVVSRHAVALPGLQGGPRPRYLQQRQPIDPATGDSRRQRTERKPEVHLDHRVLRPGEHELAVQVVVPDGLLDVLAEQPEVAWAVKDDLASALAREADAAFLHGTGGSSPLGIANTAGVLAPPPAVDPLADARAMVSAARIAGHGRFRTPGWVLHPRKLDALSGLLTTDFQAGAPGGTSLDSERLLSYDGYDGGSLLGYPFLVTSAALDPAGRPGSFFASDWHEAWVGVHERLVKIDVSAHARLESDEVVIRAVMHHDFALRRPELFTYSV
jgi:HK97 family phage major capsid protein